MAKLKFLIILAVVLVIANLIFLDWQVFQLKNKLPIKIPEEERSFQEKPVSDRSPLLESTLSVQCSAGCLQEIKKLEEKIAQISPVVGKEIEKTKTVTLRTPNVEEVSIAFGNGQTISREWEDIPGLTAYIDSSRYKNIKLARFEASLRIPTANGRVYARLFNKTDQHPVWFSEVSSEGPDSTFCQSENITLSPGNKLYQVQAKTTMGFASIIDSARVKIILQ